MFPPHLPFFSAFFLKTETKEVLEFSHPPVNHSRFSSPFPSSPSFLATESYNQVASEIGESHHEQFPDFTSSDPFAIVISSFSPAWGLHQATIVKHQPPFKGGLRSGLAWEDNDCFGWVELVSLGSQNRSSVSA